MGKLQVRRKSPRPNRRRRWQKSKRSKKTRSTGKLCGTSKPNCNTPPKDLTPFPCSSSTWSATWVTTTTLRDNLIHVPDPDLLYIYIHILITSMVEFISTVYFSMYMTDLYINLVLKFRIFYMKMDNFMNKKNYVEFSDSAIKFYV